MLSYGTARQDVRLRVFFGISIRRLCQGLKRERSILRNDFCSIAQIHPPHASLYWAVLRADDPLFAITGGLQMFGLHETSRGGSYIPPNILMHLSQLHKNGTLYLPPRKVTPPNSAKSNEAKPDGPKLETPKPTQAPPPPNSLPLRIFFAAAALALAVSTCTGLIMGWKYARRKSIVLLTLGQESLFRLSCPLSSLSRFVHR